VPDALFVNNRFVLGSLFVCSFYSMIWQKELAMATVIKWVFISALGILVGLQLVAIPTVA
jgi:hypothetical protein